MIFLPEYFRKNGIIPIRRGRTPELYGFNDSMDELIYNGESVIPLEIGFRIHSFSGDAQLYVNINSWWFDFSSFDENILPIPKFYIYDFSSQIRVKYCNHKDVITPLKENIMINYRTLVIFEFKIIPDNSYYNIFGLEHPLIEGIFHPNICLPSECFNISIQPNIIL